MEPQVLPEGVSSDQLTPQAAKLANAILQAIKHSKIPVIQLRQETAGVPDNVVNGIIDEEKTTLSEQYKAVHRFANSGEAMYMHNKSLIEVAGCDLTFKLYKAVPQLKQDVLVHYPKLYMTDNPKASNDVLVGSKGSWSPLHQDLPLYSTSVILVLEGHKEFMVLRDDVAAKLPVNLASADWERPISVAGKLYPDLKTMARATGGAVLELKSGQLMVMPPRIFHLARNCAPTVSCNFSVCDMDRVPVTVVKTFMRMEESRRDVMHFDADFARLLNDCTEKLVQSATLRATCNLANTTSRKRLPAVGSILSKSTQLMEWYTMLRCIPRGWVEGFWGDLRDRLLDNLLAAMHLHTPPQQQQQCPVGEEVVAAAEAEKGAASHQQQQQQGQEAAAAAGASGHHGAAGNVTTYYNEAAAATAATVAHAEADREAPPPPSSQDGKEVRPIRRRPSRLDDESGAATAVTAAPRAAAAAARKRVKVRVVEAHQKTDAMEVVDLTGDDA